MGTMKQIMFKGENCKQPFDLDILGDDEEPLTMFPNPTQIQAAKSLDDIKLKKVNYYQINRDGENHINKLANGTVIRSESNRGAFTVETNTIKSTMIRTCLDTKYLKPSYSYPLDFLQGDTKLHRIGECKTCFELIFYDEKKRIIGQIPFLDIPEVYLDGRYCQHELGKGSTVRISGSLEPHEAVIGVLGMDTQHYTLDEFRSGLFTCIGPKSPGISNFASLVGLVIWEPPQ